MQTTTSIMTQWIPLLIALLTAVSGVLIYTFQKRRDRAEDLVKTRRVEYRKWVQSLYDVVAADKPNALNEFNKITNDLLLFASDSVMRAVGAFKNYAAATSREGQQRDMKKFALLLATVVKEMRNDCFDKTALTDKEIVDILPIEGLQDDEP